MTFNKMLCFMTALSLSVFAKASDKTENEASKQEVKESAQVDVKKLSIAVGHLLSKTINETGIAFDLDSIIQGLKDASSGVESPLSENECISAITQEQKKSYDALASKNLAEAEKFLKDESKKKGVVSLDSGKVLYKVVQAGKGESVKENGKVLFKYKGTFLNGDVFGESSKEEIIDMNNVVVGLKQAMVGMKDGEKRVVHIHPEKAYGTEGMLPPNSLLCFEIEVAKANVEEVAQDEQPKQELERESEIR